MDVVGKGVATRSLILKPDLVELGRARHFVTEVASDAGFPEPRVFDIAVVCSEATANAIEHARVKDSVEVKALLYPDRLEVQVAGPGEFQAPSRLKDRSSRGLGLPLMALLSDHLALYSRPDGGTLVALTFYRPGAEPQDTAETLPPAVKELIESSELVLSIADSAPVGLYVLGPDLRFRWCNKSWLGFLDPCHRSGDLTGLRYEDVVPGAGDAGLLDVLESISRKGSPHSTEEFEFHGFERGVTYWRWDALPLKQSRDDPPWDILAVVSEITEQVVQRRQVEKLAKEMETERQRLETILETSPSAVVIVDADRRLSYVNRRGRELYGFDAQGLDLDLHVARVQALRPDHSPFPVEELPVSRSLVEGREVHQVQMLMRRGDGRHIPVMVSSAPLFDPGGNVIQAIAVFEDITETKTAEDALAMSKRRADLLADTATRLLASTDLQGLVESVCQRVMVELDCHVFFNFLVMEGEGRLRLNAYAGISGEQARAIEYLDFGVAVCGCAARDAMPLVAENILTTSDPRTHLVKSYGIQAYAAHPLMSQGCCIGTLSFGTRSRPTFDPDDIALMRGVTDLVALAMTRIRTEEAIKESEARFRSVLDSSHDVVYRLNLQTGRYDYVSASAESVIGYSSEELIAMDAQTTVSLIHPDDVPAFWAAVARSEKSGGAEVEYRHRTKGGDYRWVSNHMGLVRDETGRAKYRAGSISDVTVRRETEESLRRAEERTRAEAAEAAQRKRLKEVLDLLPAYLVLLAPDCSVPLANRFFEERFGKAEGRRCFEYLFGRTEPCEDCQSFTVMETGRQHRWEWAGPDGRIYDIHDFPFADSDDSPLVMEVGIDITERKQAEEKLAAAAAYSRSLIEASLDPLVTIGPDGTITDVNEATVRITGWSREELIGTDFCDYFTDPASARRGYQVVYSEGSVSDYPLTIRDRFGKLTDVLYNAAVYRDQAGQVLGVFAAARDMTAYKELLAQREIASTLQQALLDVPVEMPGVRLGHLYRSSTKAASVGGDFYDVFEVKEGKTAVLIGDVCGHGVQAARTATFVKDVIHAFAHQSVRPHEVLRRTNALLIERELRGFVTLFLAILDVPTGQVRYASAGHPEAMLRRPSGEVRWLGHGALPLGVDPEATWKSGEIDVGPGDLLLLYTDGVIEARRNGDFFGQRRLQKLLERKKVSAPRLPQLILDQLLAFSAGTLSDDVAVLALQVTEGAGPTDKRKAHAQEAAT